MSSAEPPPPLGAGPRAQPAWKREILERKRAKLAGAAGGETDPPAGAAARGSAAAAAMGERLVVAESLGPLRENPFMRLESERRRLRQGLPGHGPEAARPLQQLLELYSAVPGIRTIRADNILIIESQPDAAAASCFADGDSLPGRRREPAAASPPRRPDPLRELLARQGAALAEIRAEQVFIYEAAEPPEAAEPGTVSRLLEKFGQRPRGRRRRGGEALPGPAAAAATPRAGPVSPPPVPGSPRAAVPPKAGPGSPRSSAPKTGPGPLPAVPGSPLPLPTSPRAATPQPLPAPPQPPASPRAAAPQPPAPQAAPVSPRAVAPQAVPLHPQAPLAVPKAAAPQANCFLHKIGSNSFTVTPRGLPPTSRVPEPPGRVSEPPGHVPKPIDRVPEPISHVPEPPGRIPKPIDCVPEPSGRSAPPKGPTVPSTSAANARRPKPEEAEVAVSPPPSASLAPSATQPLSASAPRAGGSFEILPAPKPDLAAIPAHDLQAQALAKLRLNSRNSFVFVPRREGGPALPAAQSTGVRPPPSSQQKVQKEPPRVSAPEQEEPVASLPAPLDPLVPVTYIDDIVEPDSGELSPRVSLATRTGNLVDQPGGAGPDLEMEFSSVPLYRPHSASPGLHQRGGNTFTVVPKRKPVASGPQTLTDAGGRPQREEEEEEEESKGKGKAVENADGPQAGLSHKKRYPTVNEIEVIGGYLSLERSCMSKTGSRRKKMKISFNETSLQTMFEYPSESSLAEEEDEEEGHASESEEDKSRTFHIPRPNSTLHPSTPNSDLSSYTPKHSVKFSEWQEQKYEEMPASERPLLKEADSHGNQVMLTPAEKGGLSDFSSEPALYF
ncbi:taperin isoform X2 [Oxyura jamaicensis]|uniref:taperin isoform X2 n=1 Tax=Oxyura jamaicensis TaxID=8884 RepID=UPI0015A6B468|nr:taperin isoform X2 [Oxyura jamaicensis]